MNIDQRLALLGFETEPRSFKEITQDISSWLRANDARLGVVTLFCQHTSASLLISENASPAVLDDMKRWLDAAAPEGQGYTHNAEGPDDMPAHIKSTLTGASVSIPVTDGHMLLGKWQGVFLAEHRAKAQKRTVIAHFIGD